MSVRGGVEFAAGPPSHAGTTRTTPDSGLGGDERGGPRVPPPGFQNINQQQMYAGHMMPGVAPPENGNYGPTDAGGGDFKRYPGGNYAENECNGPPPGNIYNRMNMNRAVTSAAIQMQQQQQYGHSEEPQQYGNGQHPGMPPTGPGIYGGPPIHMGSNGSAMMAMPPGGPHPGMAPPPHHQQQQPLFFWDGHQYQQIFLPAAPPPNGANQQRPGSAVTSSMSTTTALSGSFESTDQQHGHHMQMTPQQQQMMTQQPPPYQQVPGVAQHMFPPQSPQQQFMPNGHPQAPMFMPPGQMYHLPAGYGGYMPPAAQNQFLVHHPHGGPMMIRQQDGTLTPVVHQMPVMVRTAPPQQMPPNEFGRPPMMFMQPPHGMVERGQMMPGMYVPPQQQHVPQGPPAYGSHFVNIRNRGGFSSMRGGKFIGGGGRGGRGRNMHTPSSVHSEPRSDSVRSDVVANMEEVAEKVGEICLDGPTSPESPSDKRKAPSKQMLQLAADVKSSEEKPCDPAPTCAAAPAAERLKPEAEKEESPADPVVTDKKKEAVKEDQENGKECTYCKSTNQSYKGHLLRESGRITCPNALVNLYCTYCRNRGGENAHTMATCPEKKNRDAPFSRDVTPRESMPKEASVRESSVDSRTSRASVTSGRQQNQGRGGYHHRGGSNDYNKNYRGRKQNYNRGGGRGGGNNSNFQDLPPQRQ